MNKLWIPRFFKKAPDGGKNSGVTGFFLIEWKKVFSIVLLKFSEEHRESYHSHAFNALTWWLMGGVVEERIYVDKPIEVKYYLPSIRPKFTPRNNLHRIISYGTTWAISFRGPWSNTWKEFNNKSGETTLTHGRKEL